MRADLQMVARIVSHFLLYFETTPCIALLCYSLVCQLICFEMKDWKGIFRYSLHTPYSKTTSNIPLECMCWEFHIQTCWIWNRVFANSLTFPKYGTWVCKGSFLNGTLLQWLVKAVRCDANFLTQISNSMYKQKYLHFNNYPCESDLWICSA